jgi:phenylpyruvate tautomerase PptA (4-oxalocrotonate tautomerase family)
MTKTNRTPKKGSGMPVYTCTTTKSTLSDTTKAALATEITRIHSAVNHVPSTYVNIVFHELPVGNIFTDATPANPLLINGWVRTGHPEVETTELVMQIAAAASRVTDVPADRVLVVLQDSPAQHAVESGHVLPRPGEEKTWLSKS